MNKKLLALTITTALTSGYAMAADEEIDMSSPTEAYTALGIGYGNEGINLKAMYMTSEPGASRKTGFILEVNDVTDQEGGDPQFSGGYGYDATTGSVYANMNNHTTNTNYRFRYGSLNTTNGLGSMVDAVIKDHPFFGQTAVIQGGALATIPIGDNAYIWPVALFGGVLMEDNFSDTIGSTDTTGVTNHSSSGVDIASTIYSTKIYGRYKFNDTWWFLGAWTYTNDLSGKSWHDSVADGGLALSPQQIELTLGYQITKTQNLRLNYHNYSASGSSDKVWMEYNYAF